MPPSLVSWAIHMRKWVGWWAEGKIPLLHHSSSITLPPLSRILPSSPPLLSSLPFYPLSPPFRFISPPPPSSLCLSFFPSSLLPLPPLLPLLPLPPPSPSSPPLPSPPRRVTGSRSCDGCLETILSCASWATRRIWRRIEPSTKRRLRSE